MQINSSTVLGVLCGVWIMLEMYNWIKNNKNRFKF